MSRRHCISRVQLEEELKLRTRPEEAYAEELVKLTVRQTRRTKCSLLLWIKKLEVFVGDAKISRTTQMSRVEKLEAQHC